MSRIVLKREGNQMRMIEFWRSEEQIKIDEDEQNSE